MVVAWKRSRLVRKKDLEATEGELRSVRAELDEMLKVKDELTSENDALETKLQACQQ